MVTVAMRPQGTSGQIRPPAIVAAEAVEPVQRGQRLKPYDLVRTGKDAEQYGC